MFNLSLPHFLLLTVVHCAAYHLDKKQERKNKEMMSETTSKDPELLLKDENLFQGDIMMDERLKRLIDGKTSKRELLHMGNLLWPKGIVFYKLDQHLTGESREMVKKAMQQFELRTCIRFKPRGNEKDYVVFTTSKKDLCSSYIGRLGGPQKIFIGESCMQLGSIQHEIMHSLGFVHEHSREDRDSYIDIHYENIEKRFLNDFEKFEIIYPKEEFDFASVMMYKNDAFSKNGKATIEAIGNDELKFGQRETFSVGDIKGINRLYHCVDHLNHPNYDGLIKSYHLNRKRSHKEGLSEVLDLLTKLQDSF